MFGSPTGISAGLFAGDLPPSLNLFEDFELEVEGLTPMATSTQTSFQQTVRALSPSAGGASEAVLAAPVRSGSQQNSASAGQQSRAAPSQALRLIEQQSQRGEIPISLMQSAQPSATLSQFNPKETARVLNEWKKSAEANLQIAQQAGNNILMQLEKYIETPVVSLGDAATRRMVETIITAWKQDVMAFFNRKYCSTFASPLTQRSSTPFTTRNMFVTYGFINSSPSLGALTGAALEADGTRTRVVFHVRPVGHIDNEGRVRSNGQNTQTTFAPVDQMYAQNLQIYAVYTPSGGRAVNRKFEAALAKVAPPMGFVRTPIEVKNPFGSGTPDLLVVEDGPFLPSVVLINNTQAKNLARTVSSVLFTSPSPFVKTSFENYVEAAGTYMDNSWVPNLPFDNPMLGYVGLKTSTLLFADSYKAISVATSSEPVEPVRAFRGNQYQGGYEFAEKMVHRMGEWICAFGSKKVREDTRLVEFSKGRGFESAPAYSLTVQALDANRQELATFNLDRRSIGKAADTLDYELKMSTKYLGMLQGDQAGPRSDLTEDQIARQFMAIAAAWNYANLLPMVQIPVQKDRIKSYLAELTQLATSEGSGNALLRSLMAIRPEKERSARGEIGEHFGENDPTPFYTRIGEDDNLVAMIYNASVVPGGAAMLAGFTKESMQMVSTSTPSPGVTQRLDSPVPSFSFDVEGLQAIPRYPSLQTTPVLPPSGGGQISQTERARLALLGRIGQPTLQTPQPQRYPSLTPSGGAPSRTFTPSPQPQPSRQPSPQPARLPVMRTPVASPATAPAPAAVVQEPKEVKESLVPVIAQKQLPAGVVKTPIKNVWSARVPELRTGTSSAPNVHVKARISGREDEVNFIKLMEASATQPYKFAFSIKYDRRLKAMMVEGNRARFGQKNDEWVISRTGYVDVTIVPVATPSQAERYVVSYVVDGDETEIDYGDVVIRMKTKKTVSDSKVALESFTIGKKRRPFE